MIDFLCWIEQLLITHSIEYQILPNDIIQTSNFKFQFLKTSSNINKNSDAICIWEDLWIKKTEIVQSKIKVKLGISIKLPARVCKIRRITKPEADIFLEENHLMGSFKSKIKYGLFLPKQYFRLVDIETQDDEILLGVATFSGARVFRDESISFELIQFCFLKNYLIQGGFSKFVNHFVKEKNPDSIMTYVDLDWYQKGGFEKFGFEEVDFLPPLFFKLNEEGEREKSSSFDFDIENKGSVKLVWKKK